MRVQRLDVEGLRCLQTLRLQPDAGLNLLLGPNGAGKTSVLEALYLLGAGKSFRFGTPDSLICRGSPALRVYAELRLSSGGVERLGFERRKDGWRAMRDGDRVEDLGQLASLMPVVVFSPESHGLVSGSSEQRRRFFDWVVFHVEPEFVSAHRRYGRLLKQRNALLKRSDAGLQLASWNQQLAEAGEKLGALRDRVFPQWAAVVQEQLQGLLPELGSAQLEYQRGWRADCGLLERLQEHREREQLLGYTLSGPHRADWVVRFPGLQVREQASRGQQKLVALSCVLASAGVFAVRRGEPPVVALDDLFSELDTEHQRRALRVCEAWGAQAWASGTMTSAALDAWRGTMTTFHVEHGKLAACRA